VPEVLGEPVRNGLDSRDSSRSLVELATLNVLHLEFSLFGCELSRSKNVFSLEEGRHSIGLHYHRNTRVTWFTARHEQENKFFDC